MSDQQFEEKYEKKDEKDEKDSTKHEEKSVEEKWRRDPLSAITWAVILIWMGLVLLANNFGMLDNLYLWKLLPKDKEIMSTGVWPLVLSGAGIILIIEVLVRLLFPIYRRPIGGNVFLAILFLGWGLSYFLSWSLVGAIVLIGLGLLILLRRA